MASPTIVKPLDNNGYGYVEFILDGTDYTGEYKISTYFENSPSLCFTYNIKLTMKESNNLTGCPLYYLQIKYYDSNGNIQSRNTTRRKGTKVKIVSGEFKVEDAMVDFWKAVEKASIKR